MLEQSYIHNGDRFVILFGVRTRFYIHGTICPRSLDPLHIVSYYNKLVKTSWTYSKCITRTTMKNKFLLKQ